MCMAKGDSEMRTLEMSPVLVLHSSQPILFRMSVYLGPVSSLVTLYMCIKSVRIRLKASGLATLKKVKGVLNNTL